MERNMSVSTVGYAVAAAICFALASALQHHAATGKQGHRSGIGLLWRLARSRRWVMGLAVAAAGVILHAAALQAGAVAVVQPVLVAGLALALPVRALLDRARPSAMQALAAAALAAGVAIFVAAAHPGAGHPAPDGRGAVTVIAAGVALAGLCAVIATQARSGRVAGFALGLAAGIVYGLVGGVLKAAVHAAAHDPAAALAGWPLWTLAVLGAWGVIMHQRAYTHAPLSVSLPVLSVANPLAGMAFGILVFGEMPASTPLALSGAMLGLAVIVASSTTLALSPARVGSHRLTPASGDQQPGTVPPARPIPAGQIAGGTAAATSAAVPPGQGTRQADRGKTRRGRPPAALQAAPPAGAAATSGTKPAGRRRRIEE
jgi:drug/metabolite transporter (DMT)-like permease